MWAGLSLRATGRGFPPATMSMIPDCLFAGVVSRDKACAALLIRGGTATSWPMCEWQFLLRMTQMKLDEGRVKLLLQPTSLQLSGDVSHLLSRFPLTLSISGSHDHQQQLPSCWDQFHNASLNRKVGRMSFLTPVLNCSYRTSSGIRLSSIPKSFQGK